MIKFTRVNTWLGTAFGQHEFQQMIATTVRGVDCDHRLHPTDQSAFLKIYAPVLWESSPLPCESVPGKGTR